MGAEMRLSVQEAPFDFGTEAGAFAAAVPGAGAVVTFTGLVRDEGGRLSLMEIEHYPGMTETAIAAMMEEAKARFHLADALVIHRYGSFPHRNAALGRANTPEEEHYLAQPGAGF